MQRAAFLFAFAAAVRHEPAMSNKGTGSILVAISPGKTSLALSLARYSHVKSAPNPWLQVTVISGLRPLGSCG